MKNRSHNARDAAKTRPGIGGVSFPISPIMDCPSCSEGQVGVTVGLSEMEDRMTGIAELLEILFGRPGLMSEIRFCERGPMGAFLPGEMMGGLDQFHQSQPVTRRPEIQQGGLAVRSEDDIAGMEIIVKEVVGPGRVGFGPVAEPGLDLCPHFLEFRNQASQLRPPFGKPLTPTESQSEAPPAVDLTVSISGVGMERGQRPGGNRHGGWVGQQMSQACPFNLLFEKPVPVPAELPTIEAGDPDSQARQGAVRQKIPLQSGLGAFRIDPKDFSNLAQVDLINFRGIPLGNREEGKGLGKTAGGRHPIPPENVDGGEGLFQGGKPPEGHTVAADRAASMKFRRSFFPASVRTDSGWNWTPWIGSSR